MAHIIQNGPLQRGHGYLYCDKCGNTGAARVSLLDWKRCNCEGERLRRQDLLDKCCTKLNTLVIVGKIKGYTVRWSESTRSWAFYIEEYKEPIQLSDPEISNYGIDSMVEAFARLLEGALS